ncbi:signal recognition particle-docking protein FtsY [Collinsella sp. D33t1_170424_A12]|uniref:signal recognition particle-docking protein FtsY n=1 Tax=Collinsella sp. D33t1_170424_A12 TaxID=2787135 RepID=UPI001899446F|nr:signal recognition particle-docking protein FtsY [Collinsella sp. D33t1_170424_A12]
MGFFDALSRGLERSREALNEVFYFGGEVDEDFWETLEDTLVMGDMGAEIAMQVTDDLRDEAARKNLRTARQLRRALSERLSQVFVRPDGDIFRDTPSCVLFVGINGAGKTTTVGKIASDMVYRGKKVVIGSADTFRAAAIEQLDVWGTRAGVPVVKRERGSDPASVCYDVLDEADRLGSDLVLIDTAGRLHTSPELMRELAKVVKVTRKRAEQMKSGPMAVHVVLVIDAATGQNGLNQALEFNDALGLDGIIMTKLDGTAKGGIALAVASRLKLPIYRVGVGEQVRDLQEFDPDDFARALVGEE